MLKKASEVIAQGDAKAAVDYAIEVNREVNHAKAELDQIKVHLRAVAKDLKDEGGEVTLEGMLGDAFIVFPPEEARGRKGQNLSDIEANLSAETFAKLFTKSITVKPARDFLEKVGSLDPAERSVVDRFVGVFHPTAKVNLPR